MLEYITWNSNEHEFCEADNEWGKKKKANQIWNFETA